MPGLTSNHSSEKKQNSHNKVRKVKKITALKKMNTTFINNNNAFAKRISKTRAESSLTQVMEMPGEWKESNKKITLAKKSSFNHDGSMNKLRNMKTLDFIFERKLKPKNKHLKVNIFVFNIIVGPN